MYRNFHSHSKNKTAVAVLVAVSIPIFTSQLEKARDATSVANLRSAYAEASAAFLADDDSNPNVTLTKPSGSTTTGTVAVAGVTLQGELEGWSDVDSELPFVHTVMTGAIGGTPGTYTATFTFGADGTVTLTKLEK